MQGFYLDQRLGGNAILGGNGRLIVHIGHCLTHFGTRQQHLHPAVGQLQSVPIPSGNKAGIAAVSAGGSQSTQNIVCLPAGALHGGVAQSGKQLLKHRHLGPQLLRHGLTPGLIVRILLVAESRLMHIKGHRHTVRVASVLQLKQNIQKAVNGVGIIAALGGQQLNAVEGTVDDTVPVQHQKIHESPPKNRAVSPTKCPGALCFLFYHSLI